MNLLKGILRSSILVSAFSFVAIAQADEVLMKDARDGREYHKVNLGSSEWLAENLNFKARNSSCYDNAASCDQNGRLYNWEVAMSVCPEGWRLPTDEEWNAVLIAQGGWRGLEQAGVNLPMAGDRRADGVYHYLGESAFYWTATAAGKKHFRYKFDANNPQYDRSSMVEGPAYSVKCVAGYKPCTTPIMNAVRKGDIKKVKYLLDNGVSVNDECFTENEKEMTSVAEGYESISLLGMAIDKKNQKMVQFLLDQGANPNRMDESGPSDEALSMLTRALLKGDKNILKMLLEKKAEVGFCDVALSITAKDDLLKMVIEKLTADEMNQCWFGQSLVDVFESKPAIQNFIIKRGGLPGPKACPVAPGEEAYQVANTRMCGD